MNKNKHTKPNDRFIGLILIIILLGLNSCIPENEEKVETEEMAPKCVISERVFTIWINIDGVNSIIIDTIEVKYDDNKKVISWPFSRYKRDTILYENGLPKFINQSYQDDNVTSDIYSYENFYGDDNKLIKRIKTEFYDQVEHRYIDTFMYNEANQLEIRFQRFESVMDSEVNIRRNILKENYEFSNDNLIEITGEEYQITNNELIGKTYTKSFSEYSDFNNPFYKTPVPSFFDRSLSLNFPFRISSSDSWGSSSNFSISECEANEFNFPLCGYTYHCD